MNSCTTPSPSQQQRAVTRGRSVWARVTPTDEHAPACVAPGERLYVTNATREVRATERADVHAAGLRDETSLNMSRAALDALSASSDTGGVNHDCDTSTARDAGR
jgi:hypothetical protein